MLLVPIFAICFGLFAFLNAPMSPLSGTIDPVIVMFSVLVGTVFGGAFAILIGLFLPTYFVEVRKRDLISLRGGSMTEGSFFLGCGSLANNLYYIYYKKTDDGGYQQGMLGVLNEVTIFEEDRNEGLLKIYERQFVNSWHTYIAFLGDLAAKKYEFHIPKGSLKKNFILE